MSGPRKLKKPCSRTTAGRPFPPTLKLVRGAPMENLTHSASFDSDDNDAPSSPGGAAVEVSLTTIACDASLATHAARLLFICCALQVVTIGVP